MVDQMLKADDLFFDAVSQIRMPIWSSGRVVLTGDAAHATSFLSGQGSSCALVSAYVLAGELATHANYQEAFATRTTISSSRGSSIETSSIESVRRPSPLMVDRISFPVITT